MFHHMGGKKAKAPPVEMTPTTLTGKTTLLQILPQRRRICQVSRTCRCRDCGEDGFYPVVYADEGYGWERCPTCGSDRIEWGNKCPLCGRYAEGIYCDDCAQNLRDRFHELLICNFDKEEIKALNEIFDGKELE
jgi:hypothetical protein